MIRYSFRALTIFAVENRIAGFGWSTTTAVADPFSASPPLFFFFFLLFFFFFFLLFTPEVGLVGRSRYPLPHNVNMTQQQKISPPPPPPPLAERLFQAWRGIAEFGFPALPFHKSWIRHWAARTPGEVCLMGLVHHPRKSLSEKHPKRG